MRILVAVLALMMLLATPATAARDDAALLQQVQDYLSSITTLQARFVQTSQDGLRATGNFLLKRPGRMRFEYDKPITDFIVADGSLIYYYDGQMKQQTSGPISKSLADFFLRRNLNLSGDIRVADIRRKGGDVYLRLVQAKDPLSGSLTLVLNEKPMMLKKWRVLDSQGLVTEVELFDTVMGIRLSNELFRYYDPKRRGPQYN
jgi:outer membrane lipoprotein-sorting protein